MVTSAMLARQITHPPAPNRANSFPPTLLRTLQLSCRSFFRPRPLFSIACTLFAQNTRGGGTPQRRLLPSRHSDVQILRPADAISFAVCFHNDTNPSSHNSFLFASMQIPRGCGGAAILRVRPSRIVRRSASIHSVRRTIYRGSRDQEKAFTPSRRRVSKISES